MTKGEGNFYERVVVIYYKQYKHLTHLFSQTCLVTLPWARMGAFDFQSEQTFVIAFLMPSMYEEPTQLQQDVKSLFNFSQKESQGKNIWKHEVVVIDTHSILRSPLNHKGNKRESSKSSPSAGLRHCFALLTCCLQSIYDCWHLCRFSPLEKGINSKLADRF